MKQIGFQDEVSALTVLEAAWKLADREGNCCQDTTLSSLLQFCGMEYLLLSTLREAEHKCALCV